MSQPRKFDWEKHGTELVDLVDVKHNGFVTQECTEELNICFVNLNFTRLQWKAYVEKARLLLGRKGPGSGRFAKSPAGRAAAILGGQSRHKEKIIDLCEVCTPVESQPIYTPAREERSVPQPIPAGTNLLSITAELDEKLIEDIHTHIQQKIAEFRAWMPNAEYSITEAIPALLRKGLKVTS